MVQKTFKVRGGKDHVDPVNQLESYDTWSTIVAATAETYGISVKQAEAALRKANPNIPNAKKYYDPKCKDYIMDIRVKDDQIIKLPGDKEINPELVTRPCVKPKPVPDVVDPAGSETKITPPATQTVEATVRPLAQFVPPPSGQVELGYAMQRWNYFFGVPPKDVTALKDHKAGKIRDGVILPEDMEGRSTKLTGKRDSTNALRDGEEGRFFSGRARQELPYAPESTYLRDARGLLVPNERYKQKLEENVNSFVNGEGKTVEAVLGEALISIRRRRNSEHAGIFTDVHTATNLIGKWTMTAPAITALTEFRGIDEGYPVVAKRFFAGAAGANASADAKALLDMNVRLALNPIMWSLNSRGVSVTDISAVSAAMDKVFTSEQFKALPAAEQEALTAKFRPLQAKLADPESLFVAVGGKQGVAALTDPLDAMVEPRANLAFIQRGFGRDAADGSKRPDGVDKTTWRTENAIAEGRRYAREIAVEAPRPPHQAEYEIGTAVAFNTQRQSAAAITAATGKALRQIQSDDVLLDHVITQFATTPGAVEKLTGLAFDASIKKYEGNRRAIGFEKNRDADAFNDRMGVALGGEVYKGQMDHRGRNLFDSLANIPQKFIGYDRSGDGRNQNRGVFVKGKDGQIHVFSEDFKNRWVNGTDAEKAAIRQFFKNDLVPQLIKGHENGIEKASARFMSGLSPLLDQQANGGKPTANFTAIETKLGGKVLMDAIIAQANVTEQVGAEVEQATERLAMNGGVTTVTEEQANAAIAAGSVTIAGGNNGAATVLNVDAANNARTVGSQARVLLQENNPDRIGQGQINRENVLVAMAAKPAYFSAAVLQTAAKLKGPAADRLDGYLKTVDKGDKDASRYADMMKPHLEALEKAGSNPAAIKAANDAALADLQGYFAGAGKHDGARQAAASRLAGLIAKDGEVAAAFTAELQAIAATADKAEVAAIQSKLAAAGLNGSVIAGVDGTAKAKPVVVPPLAEPLLTVQGITDLVGVATNSKITADVKTTQVEALLAEGTVNGGKPLTAAQTKTLTQIVLTGGSESVATSAITFFSTTGTAPVAGILAGKNAAGKLQTAPTLTDEQAVSLRSALLAGKDLTAVNGLLAGFANPAADGKDGKPVTSAPVNPLTLTAAQLTALQMQISAGATPAQINATLQTIAVANNAGINAGKPGDINAGKPGDLNAGKPGDLNAGSNPLLSGIVNGPDPKALAQFLAGIDAGVTQLGAKPGGISLEAYLATIAAAFIPGGKGPIDEVIPEVMPGGCGGVGRPICPPSGR